MHLKRRFASFESLREFTEPNYTEDGGLIESDFMREIHLTQFEPSSIELAYSAVAKPLNQLLKDISYSDQWLSHLISPEEADSAVCIFEPNLVHEPECSSLEYVGSFSYEP